MANKFFFMVPHAKLIQIQGVLETLLVISYKVYSSVDSIKKLRFYEVLPSGTVTAVDDEVFACNFKSLNVPCPLSSYLVDMI
jgi:hypothetical protein